MKHTIKKLSALLLALVMVLALATVTTVAKTGVKYLDENGAEQTLESGYTPVVDFEGAVPCSSGWYVVSEDATITGRITVNGNVKLILCDGKTLTAKKGITVQGDNSLTIYAQSVGDTAGVLDITTGTTTANAAGIGGMSNNDNGTVIINGGIIKVKAGSYAAGIGGGYGAGGGTITINGGVITATGTAYGAGIGVGGFSNNNAATSITINGGTVTAIGGSSSQAIGKGSGSTTATVTLGTGVTVKAGASATDNADVTDFETNHAYAWAQTTKAAAAPATPTDATPTDATPTDATPTDATPTDATPTDATPTDTTKELTVTSPLGAITRVTVDGKDVDSKDYTVQGGTVVLSKDFIRNLAAGAHTIRVYQGSSYSTASYTAGENAATVVAATGITSPVSGNADAVKTTSPKTADPGLALYGVLAISSTLGLAVVGKRKEH